MMSSVIHKIVLSTIAIITFVGCNQNDPNHSADNSNIERNEIVQNNQFKDYWYSGTAELNRYKLKQARYGQIHDGEAVLIFVTEDFLNDKQVKFEGTEKNENVESILKLNFMRKFNTGIYPYSLMSSIFTPVNGDATLKVTTSVQEWCGQTYAQFNRKGNGYEAKLYSYFMDEADAESTVDADLLEDEIWNMIRLKPENLPQGEIKLVPSFQYLRMKHGSFQEEQATASLNFHIKDSVSTQTLNSYKIEYKNINRTLQITFESDFPHSILSWKETVDTGFGKEGSITTEAIRTHSINEPYWKMNSAADSVMRQKLGLKY